MKNFSKLLRLVMVSVVIMIASSITSFAATIGQSLTAPESSWQRIDDSDSCILKIGSYKTYIDSGLYGGTAYHSTGDDSRVKISFWGTKIRLIGWTYNGYRISSIDIILDGNIIGRVYVRVRE